MIRAIIVDDEDHCREVLADEIGELDGITILESCSTIESARNAILKYAPDLLFLDVEMPGKNGFDLLEELKEKELRFDVIFTTSYEQYALRAIRASALDFLLKPIDKAELSAAIQKHLEKKQGDIGRQVEVLLQHYSGNQQKKSMLALPTSEGLEMVGIENIIRLQADGAYTNFYLSDKKKLTVSRNLKEYEDVLSIHQFLRIHHSNMVNLRFVKKYTKGEGGYVTMHDGSSADVSRQKKQELLEALKGL